MKTALANDLVELHWEEMRADARRRWPELSDNDLAVIDGHKDMLIGVLQERYWVSREEAAREADDFEREWSEKAA